MIWYNWSDLMDGLLKRIHVQDTEAPVSNETKAYQDR